MVRIEKKKMIFMMITFAVTSFIFGLMTYNIFFYDATNTSMRELTTPEQVSILQACTGLIFGIAAVIHGFKLVDVSKDTVNLSPERRRKDE